MKNKTSKKIAVLGSTGSIGKQTLNVCRRLNYKVEAMSCNKNIELFFDQICEFKPSKVALADSNAAKQLRIQLENSNLEFIPEILVGIDGISYLASLPYDCVVMAIIGFAALHPMLSAINARQTIAMANKEVMVGVGEFILQLAEDNGAKIYPIDSEPSAIWQCVQGNHNVVNKVLLTASGGPFRTLPFEEFGKITPEEALKHPVWSMGRKITIDSATMMNKGLEMIEICRLFKLQADQIDVLVHPQGIIHSAVEFADGGVIAQMGMPDMELPIQFALTYPQREPMPDKQKLDLTVLQDLQFEQPDAQKFPALNLARKALEIGGSLPAILNAANEIAVDHFIRQRISFTDISNLVEKTMENSISLGITQVAKIEDVLMADQWAREYITSLIV